MIPLTTSMYVAGVMENVDKVTIDIGTGYFVEKTIEQAEEFFKVSPSSIGVIDVLYRSRYIVS